ncbi:MAG: hypothetical protein KDA71_23530 [Planctomycetales bacterium]|nr:hypothetical protein [Planctomycetales bacterium]
MTNYIDRDSIAKKFGFTRGTVAHITIEPGFPKPVATQRRRYLYRPREVETFFKARAARFDEIRPIKPKR